MVLFYICISELSLSLFIYSYRNGLVPLFYFLSRSLFVSLSLFLLRFLLFRLSTCWSQSFNRTWYEVLCWNSIGHMFSYSRLSGQKLVLTCFHWSYDIFRLFNCLIQSIYLHNDDCMQKGTWRCSTCYADWDFARPESWFIDWRRFENIYVCLLGLNIY